MVKHIIFILLMVGGGYYFWSSRPVVHGPGVVAPNEPIQEQAYGIKAITHEGYTFSPFAKMDLEVRILSKKKYYEDRESEFAPYDFVVGWGPMSDEKNLDKLLIKQTDRYYYWEMIEPPIPVHDIRTHSANMRFISPSTEIAERLDNLRIGQIIRVKGYLVNVKAQDGWKAESSKIRTDSGEEATEIIYIRELSVM